MPVSFKYEVFEYFQLSHSWKAFTNVLDFRILVDLYEPPSQAKPPVNDQSVATGGDADERIAEAFRREFMDAISARHRRKPAGTQSGRGSSGKKEDELLKGPKLGGSRSARAAMREAALREAKKR